MRLPPRRVVIMVTLDPDDTPIDEVPSPESVQTEIQANLKSVWPAAVVTVVVCG